MYASATRSALAPSPLALAERLPFAPKPAAPSPPRLKKRPLRTRWAEPSAQVAQPPAVTVAGAAAGAAGVLFEGRSLGVVFSAAAAVRATAAETPSASRPRTKRFMSTPFGSDPGGMASNHVYHRRFARAARMRLEEFRRRRVGLAEGVDRTGADAPDHSLRPARNAWQSHSVNACLNRLAITASASPIGRQRSTRRIVAGRRGNATNRFRDATALRMRRTATSGSISPSILNLICSVSGVRTQPGQIVVTL